MHVGNFPGGPFRFIPLLAAFGVAFFSSNHARAEAPAITALSAPRQVVTLNQNLTLNVTAPAATSFQWKRNGRPLPGATTASHTITAATPARDGGWYQVVATNASGSTASVAIFVNVVVTRAQTLGWGISLAGLTPELANVTAVAVAATHGLALRADGTVTDWHASWSQAGPAPTNLTDVVAVACGQNHSLALRSDGTVWAWGGYTSNGSWNVEPGPVAGLTDVVAIADSYAQHVALRRNGTVVVFGYETALFGSSPLFQPFPTVADVVSIAADSFYILAVRANGTVIASGSMAGSNAIVPPGLTGVVAVCAGYPYAGALRSDGSVVTWGDGVPATPSDLNGVVVLTTGQGFFAALQSDGRAIFWGSREAFPTLPFAEISRVQLISAGDSRLVAVADAAAALAPTVTAQPVGITTGLGQVAVFQVAATGEAPLSYRWQRQAAMASGFSDLVDQPGVYSGAATPVLSVGPTTGAMRGDLFRCVVRNGIIPPAISSPAVLTVSATPAFSGPAEAEFTLGRSASFVVGVIGAPAPTFRVIAGDFPSWAALDAASGVISGSPPAVLGSPFSFSVEASNGIGSAVVRNFTLTVRGVERFTALPAPRHAIARGQHLTLTGAATGATAYQWKRNGLPLAGATAAKLTRLNVTPARDNGWYQLVAIGGGDPIVSPPVFVNVTVHPAEIVSVGHSWGTVPTGLPPISAVAGGITHSLALQGDGRVVWWGESSDGPTVPPANLTDVVSLAVQVFSSIAVRSDGTVVAWGPAFAVPLPPADLVDVVSAALGNSHGLALKADGTVVAWGSNVRGQLDVPAGLSTVVAVAAGLMHSLALKADGTVVAWGGSDYGQATVPPGLTDVAAITASNQYSVALKKDGTVVAWGENLGSSAPLPDGLSAVEVVIGSGHSLALKSDGTVLGWGSNASGELSFPGGPEHIVSLAANSGASILLRDRAPPAAPVLTGSATARFIVGRPGSLVPTATGSPSPTFAVSTGALPAWATLDPATGALAGTPPDLAGSPFIFTLAATNGIGSAATQTISLTVQPGHSADVAPPTAR
jgi:alpha-tubulin suppressor-like RCC1 family protein